jgi:predicted HTH domain antitoxin
VAVQIDLPQELIDSTGDRLERDLLEGLLLKLVSEGQITLAKAAGLLGMSRWEAIQWYTSHGLVYPPNLNRDELVDEFRHAFQD